MNAMRIGNYSCVSITDQKGLIREVSTIKLILETLNEFEIANTDLEIVDWDIKTFDQNLTGNIYIFIRHKAKKI